MFRADMSFNQQEKANIFALEAKAFFQSYVDALNFVK